MQNVEIYPAFLNNCINLDKYSTSYRERFPNDVENIGQKLPTLKAPVFFELLKWWKEIYIPDLVQSIQLKDDMHNSR